MNLRVSVHLRSAPPNGAEELRLSFYKHHTPDGVGRLAAMDQ
jgi:hypothetical protein